MNPPDQRSPAVKTGRPVLRWPPHRWVMVLVAISLAWRLVRYGVCFPMWGDEAFVAVNFLTRSFGELTGPLDHPQIVPAGFLWSQWLISRVIGTGEMALRFLPTVAGAISLLVFWRLAPKMVGRRQAMAAVALFAASYYPVRHSVEVKPYSLDLLFALVLVWQAWALCQIPRSVWRWVLFFVIGAAAVWFSYPAVFILGGAMCVLAYRLYEERVSASWFVGWVIGGAVMAVSFLAMWKLVAVGQQVHHEGIHELRGWASAFPPLDSPTGLIAWFFRAHTGNMFAYPVGGNNGGSIATSCLILFGIIALWRTRRRLLLALLVSPLPFMFLAAALKKYPYGDSARVAQHLAPMACLLAGAGLVAFLNHGWKKRGVVTGMQIVCVAMLGIIVVGLMRDVIEPYKKESDKFALETVRELARQSAPGDTWVVFGSLRDLDYAPNFLGSREKQTHSYGGSLARLRYNMFQYAPKGVEIDWAPPPDRVPVPQAESSTWLFFYHDNDAEDNPFPQDLADRYLEAITSRLGGPVHEVYPLMEDEERLEVYRFRAEQPGG